MSARLWLNTLRKRCSMTCSENALLLGAALFFSFFENFAFWKRFFTLLGSVSLNNILFTGSVFVVMTTTIYLLFTLLLWSYWLKPMLALFFIVSAGAGYFMTTFGVYMDRDMIANIVGTTVHESFALVTPQFLIWIFFFGVLPAILCWSMQLKRPASFLRILRQRFVRILLCLFTLFAVVAPMYQSYAAFFRVNKPIGKLMNPTNYLYSSVSYTAQRFEASRPLIQIGLDAKRAIPGTVHKPTLFVLVVGETSRAQNTQLLGYDRPTNPLLSAQKNVVVFANTTSCGTNTATSVPCMFSDMPREAYDAKKASHEENFLDMFQRLGIHVLWKENDSNACFNICTRIPLVSVPQVTPAQYCPEGLCYDEHLLDGLDKYIAGNKQGDLFIVLHTNGSHGPSYFKRYPANMPHQFQPACQTDQLQNCSHEALVNAYDNTMVHMDAMLNDTITFLKQYDQQYNTAMFYVSDHGESLGENGIYLHSFPYMIAPKEQTHVPMFFWSDPDFLSENDISAACMKQHAKSGTFSHDNLFHSMLGIMHVSTREYQPSLDVFAPCRTAGKQA